MPGLILFFTFFGDEQDQRWPICLPDFGQRIKFLRCLIKSRLEEIDSQRFAAMSADNLRLFFNGQQLDDQYCIKNYGIIHNDLIKLTVITVEPPQSFHLARDNHEKNTQNDANCDDHLKSETYHCLQKDDFYEIGDHVDAFDPETSGWFPARIVQIKHTLKSEQDSSFSNTKNHYFVAFDKPSMGGCEAKSLEYVRPPPDRIIERDGLHPGEIVMALNDDGQWSVGAIDWVKRSIKNRSIRLWLTMFVNGEEMPMVRQMIKYQRGNILALESNVKISERSEDLDKVIKFGSKIDRKIKPDCTTCKDDGNVSECKQCGCQICYKKIAPDKQLICDECGLATHFWCLQSSVIDVPNDPEWYCDKCRNLTYQQIVEKQKSHLNQQVSYRRTCSFGMTNVGKSPPDYHRPRSDVFGPISEVPVGSWWRFRVQAAEAGVHAPLVAGIHGREQHGAYSVVYSAQNSNDVDLGDEIYYTANGGGVRGVRRKRFGVTKDGFSQQLKREILALAKNCPVEVNQEYGGHAGAQWQSGKPIRLLRNGNNCHRMAANCSKYLPKMGVRYDGLYKVVQYWPEAGINGHRVWRFLLRRDDKEPAPWTEAGRYQARKLGLTIQYPRGWCKELAQKRSWKIDEKMRKRQKSELVQNQSKNKRQKIDGQKTITGKSPEKVEYFEIPQNLKQMIMMDELNSKSWCQLLESKMTKKEFIEEVTRYFRCVCCLDQMNDPITTDCGHNFCSECVQQYLDNEDNQKQSVCPVCRRKSFLAGRLRTIKCGDQNGGSKTRSRIIKTNMVLEQILTKIKTL